MSPALSLAADNTKPAPVEPVGGRIQRLQAEARQLARDHVKALTTAMASLEELAAEIAEGGEVYSVGARNEARTLAEDLARRIETLNAICHRSDR